MTAEELACLAIGQAIAAGFFSLGILVGSSLQTRKDVRHDDSNEKARQWAESRERYHDSLR